MARTEPDNPAPPGRASARRIILPCFVTALLLIPFAGYRTDDGYIYAQFARNLAAGHGFSFNPTAPAYGFASPLWVLLLAAAARLGLPLIAAGKILGALFAVLTVPAFHRLARQIVPTSAAAFAATLAWSANVWLVRWALAGLETPLAMLLILLACGAWIEERRRDLAPGVSAFLLGLACLARPECLLLLALAGVDIALSGFVALAGVDAALSGFAAPSGSVAPSRSSRSSAVRLLRLASLSGVVLAPWLIYAAATFGALLPATVHAKGGSWFGLAGVAPSLRRIVPVFGATVAVEILAIAFAIALELRRDRRATAAAESAGARPRLRGYFLLAAWTIALPLLYVVRGATVVSRYMLPAIPFVILFGFAALDRITVPFASDRATPGSLTLDQARRPARLRSRAPWLLLAASAVLNLSVLFASVLPAARAFTRGLDGSLVPIAQWLKETTPPETSVAAPDIGVLGFVGERTVVDLRGLVTPSLAPLQQALTYDQIVERLAFAEQVHPDYLVDRFTTPLRFDRRELRSPLFEPVLWRRMGDLGTIRRGDYYYTLYRLHWDQLASPTR